MNASSNRDYLEQRIKTASPAQLHLLLIEGALRFANLADKGFQDNDEQTAADPLRRAMDIVSELLAGVKHSQDDVNLKLAQLYQFVFTRLTMAYVNTDRSKLIEAIRILDIERETWRQACEKVASDQPAGAARVAEPKPTPAIAPPHKPHSQAVAPAMDLAADLSTGGGLSLEA